METIKLVFFVTGVKKETGRPYYGATFKRMGYESWGAKFEAWLDEEVATKFIKLGLDQLVLRTEPEVLLTFGFGGKITDIKLAEGSDITTQPFDDEVVFE